MEKTEQGKKFQPGEAFIYGAIIGLIIGVFFGMGLIH